MLCPPDNDDNGNAIARMACEDHAPGAAGQLNGGQQRESSRTLFASVGHDNGPPFGRVRASKLCHVKC